MGGDRREEKMVKRGMLIAGLVDPDLDQQEYRARRREIARENGISERTISRWVERYAKGGAEALKPGTDGRPGSRSIDPGILRQAVQMRLENPRRSVANIIRTLEYDGVVQPGTVKRATLQDHLVKARASKSQIMVMVGAASSGGRRFQRPNRNDLWQSDAKHGIYIISKTPKLIKPRKTYLITFIDDCTRFVLHSQFYFEESTRVILDALRKAITKHGAPKDLYLDNGTPYKSRSIERACGILTIRKRHCKPYSAKSKGKIEKFHQIVDKFISEIRLEKVYELDDLNKKWQDYLLMYYQIVPHSALGNGASPELAFKGGRNELRYPDEETLDLAFLMVEKGRKVDKSGCLNFDGGKITADTLMLFVGRRGDIVWDPSDKSRMWVEIDGQPRIQVKPLEIKDWAPKPKRLPGGFAAVRAAGSRILQSASRAARAREAEVKAAFPPPPEAAWPEPPDSPWPGQSGSMEPGEPDAPVADEPDAPELAPRRLISFAAMRKAEEVD